MENNDMKNNFKKVLFVGPHYLGQWGGMSSVLEIYSKSITPFNFISAYQKRNAFFNICYFIKAIFIFTGRLITDRDIKIVHLQSAAKASFVRKSTFLLIAKLFGKKTVMHIHAGGFKMFYKKSGIFRFMVLYVLNAADELVCLSDEWKTYYDSITKKPKAIVVNNPVILPVSVQQRTLSYPVKVLFLNHITKDKGFFDLANFFNQNKDWLKGSFKLLVAGGGDVEEMEKFVKANNLDELIEYRGWVSGKEKDDLFQEADIFILPSYYEGLPMSILEAMAFGEPVISTNVGGIPRIVRPGKNGWLVEPADLNGLAKVFQEIKSNPEVLEKYGRKSLEIVKDYCPEKVKENLNEIYDRLLA
jgi:glycosyltransferase involved in cell wall biosynthesis